MILRKNFKRLFKRQIVDNDRESLIKKGHLICKPSSNIKDLRVVIRMFEKREFVRIGEDCLIKGNFIIENHNGYISVGDRTFIGGGRFISVNRIEIGDDVLISWGCTFMDNNAHSLNWEDRKNDVIDWKRGEEEGTVGKYKDWNNIASGPISVENKAWIGFDVVILKGVTIGEGAVVGSRSVVTKDVPSWTIVAGNPAKVIREIPKSERA